MTPIRCERTQRRRSLFPSSDNDDHGEDPDLGRIRPLEDSGCEGEDQAVESYHILDVVRNEDGHVQTPDHTAKTSPIKLSQHRTPHESTSSPKLPKLTRKSVSGMTCNKRKLSPCESPEQNKLLKFEPKNPKVRTTLFPENAQDNPDSPCAFSIPPDKFYPDQVDIMQIIKRRRPTVPSTSLNITKRTTVKRTKRGKLGTINNGISYKIAKKKPKKFVKKIANYDAAAIKTYLASIRELRENKENETQRRIVMPKVPDVSTVEGAKKRPPSPLPSQPRKFFKSQGTNKTVTLTDGIKLTVDNNELKILKEGNTSSVINAGSSFMDESDFLTGVVDVERIITSLDSSNVPEPNKVLVPVYNSTTPTDDSILIHKPPQIDPILSPISQMCNVTSGLALNSPKRAKDLTAVLSKMPNPKDADEKGSSFGGAKPRMKLRRHDNDQTLIDAGQKKLGETICPTYNLLYYIGDYESEVYHENYHQGYWIFRFSGWKNERVVANCKAGRIIQVKPEDSKFWWKKCITVISHIDKELGCYEGQYKNTENYQVFLYVKRRLIIGFLMAVPKTEAHRMLPFESTKPDRISDEVYPVRCGVSRLWVASSYRKHGIGRALMDSLKINFIYGTVMRDEDIALSTPTELGRVFATKYFKSENFLVYVPY